METAKQKNHWLPGFVMILTGAAIASAASLLQRSGSESAAALGEILALVLTGWGIATILWQFQQTIFKLAGPLCIFAGGLILLASLLLHSVLGVLAGGFLAIVGAILSLGKK